MKSKSKSKKIKSINTNHCLAKVMNNWNIHFGSVVWAKVDGIPWWPCYICDPISPDFVSVKNEELKKEAIEYSLNNTKFLVYFYGETMKFGFVTPEKIEHFDKSEILPPNNKKTLKFKIAVQLATADSLLPKSTRAPAYLIPSKSCEDKKECDKFVVNSKPPAKFNIDSKVSSWESREVMRGYQLSGRKGEEDDELDGYWTEE
jgi:hypothetical protein